MRVAHTHLSCANGWTWLFYCCHRHLCRHGARDRDGRALRARSALFLCCFFFSSIYSVKKACTNNRTNQLEKTQRHRNENDINVEWSGDAVDMIFACFFSSNSCCHRTCFTRVSFFPLRVVVAHRHDIQLHVIFGRGAKRAHRNRKFIPKNYRS